MSHNRPIRSAKAPLRIRKDNAEKEPCTPLESQWCNILCVENNKVYKCLTTSLSTDDKDHVSEADLQLGNELVWSYKGKKYTAILKDMNDNSKEHDSNDSADEDIIPRPAGTNQASKAVKKAEIPRPADTNQASKAVQKPNPRMAESSSSALHGALVKVTNELQDIKKVMASLTESVSNLTKQMGVLTDVVTLLAERLPTECSSSTKNAMQENAISQLTVTAKPPASQVVATGAQAASGSKQAYDQSKPEKFILESGLNLLSLKAVDIFKYALILMDALFTDKEMSTCCFQQAERGISSSKTPLSPRRVKLLEECIVVKFGQQAYVDNCSQIRDKLNQKCRDKAKKVPKPSTSCESQQHQSFEL